MSMLDEAYFDLEVGISDISAFVSARVEFIGTVITEMIDTVAVLLDATMILEV